jgi:hypothetical protein
MIKHAMIVTLSALLSGEAMAAIRMIQAAVVPLEQALGGSCLLGNACGECLPRAGCHRDPPER